MAFAGQEAEERVLRMACVTEEIGTPPKKRQTEPVFSPGYTKRTRTPPPAPPAVRHRPFSVQPPTPPTRDVGPPSSTALIPTNVSATHTNIGADPSGRWNVGAIMGLGGSETEGSATAVAGGAGAGNKLNNTGKKRQPGGILTTTSYTPAIDAGVAPLRKKGSNGKRIWRRMTGSRRGSSGGGGGGGGSSVKKGVRVTTLLQPLRFSLTREH